MPLVPDNSIPFPQDAPDLFDIFRFRGVSGTVYEWPESPRLLGLVRVRITPPNVRSKISTKAGAKKPRVKDVGNELAKASVKFEVARKGWPTFIALVRMLVDGTDGPWRILCPAADIYNVRSFKVEKLPEFPDDMRGVAIVSCDFIEVEPETQAGNGANAGVNSPGAIAYNLEAEAYARMRAEQLAIQQSQENAVRLAKEADAARKPGVLVAKRMPVDKAAAFGKIEL